MKRSFKTASIWGIIWRFTLFSILFGVILSLVMTLMSVVFFIPALTNLLINLLIYGVLLFVVYRRVKKQNFSWDAFTGKYSIQLKPILKIGLLTLLMVITASTFSYFLLLFINLFDGIREIIQPFFEFILSTNVNISGISIFITTVIAAPIVEETFFRGYLLNKWAEKYKVTSAIFWTSFIFMIIHIPSLFLPQFLIGLLCAIIYIKTKQLIYPIIAHAFYNFVVVLPTLFSSPESTSQTAAEEIDLLFNPSAETMQAFMIGTAVFIISLAALLYFFKKFGKNMNQELTPYVANIDSAPDFAAAEENQESDPNLKQQSEDEN